MPILQAQIRDRDQKLSPGEALVQLGPTIGVLVGQPPVPTGKKKRKPTLTQVLGLIDTGASTSCIDQAFAQSLGLTIIDERDAYGIGGKKKHPVFLALVQSPELKMQRIGEFTGVDMPGGHKVLLGREFLLDMVFIYDGNMGIVTICR